MKYKQSGNDESMNHEQISSASKESLVLNEDLDSVDDKITVKTSVDSSISNKLINTQLKNYEELKNDSETNITNENIFEDESVETKNSVQNNIPKIQTHVIGNKSSSSVNRPNRISNKSKENLVLNMVKNFETASKPKAINKGKHSSNLLGILINKFLNYFLILWVIVKSLSTIKNIQNDSKSLEMLPNNSEISFNLYHSVNSNVS